MKKTILIFTATILGIVACNERMEETIQTSTEFDSNSIAMTSNLFPFDLPQSNINYTNISNYHDSQYVWIDKKLGR
jgi:hypothetical protein